MNTAANDHLIRMHQLYEAYKHFEPRLRGPDGEPYNAAAKAKLKSLSDEIEYCDERATKALGPVTAAIERSEKFAK